ncbi:hypothetical protein DICSQDRAFT_128281 [Dichomitus squalens LYAD-421 SS1]|uniref:Uncharacterized protein n=1 Tax=Dichomitus squalens (strain LYAD-421) TaxID=732165 RepID=R7STL9_DICSQ|nr:uncharacterized protein DICSQDRAFT_128281 [Dichomitus squalens LYAD-421 SS1]EJF59416.1 hypothetical protein DICSQDRAFT_128281 [Dichomitus squalens LYAD-421 SS1]
MTLSLWEPFAASHGHESRATGEEGEAVHRDGNIPRYATHSLPRSDAFKQHCCNFPPPAKHRANLRSETLGLWRHRRIVHFLSADRAILASEVASSHIPSRTMVAAYSGYRVRVGASVEGLRAQYNSDGYDYFRGCEVQTCQDEGGYVGRMRNESGGMRSTLSQAGVRTRTSSGSRAIKLDVVKARGVHPMLGGSFVNLASEPLSNMSRKTPRTQTISLDSSPVGLGVCMIWEKPRCYSTPSYCLYFCRLSDKPPKWLSSIAAEDIAHTYATGASASNELVK